MNSQLSGSVEALLTQIRSMLEALTDRQYQTKLPVLSGASLGAHVRHLIEFFIELEQGYQTGVVNYDARNRALTIETERYIAMSKLDQISKGLVRKNKTLSLVTSTDLSDIHFEVATNYERELVYNLEHTVHHMAIIKIGFRNLTGEELSDDFGVASSTIRYRKEQCVQ